MSVILLVNNPYYCIDACQVQITNTLIQFMHPAFKYVDEMYIESTGLQGSVKG